MAGFDYKFGSVTLIVVRLNMIQNLHLWLDRWKLSAPITARNGSLTHFGVISAYR